MPKINYFKGCCGCSACASICPTHCIKLVEDQKGFLYPKVEAEKCINCGKCDNICPVLSRKLGLVSKKEAYAALTKDEHVRELSSSGGIFYELSQQTLKDGGVVFGATCIDGLKVVHQKIEKGEEIIKLCGSKYSQSDTSSIFEQVKRELSTGRKVLFSGTPCQVAGLSSFLNKPYENLILVDLICHGVPSPLIWKKYVDYIGKKTGSTAKEVYFREKSTGWRTFSLKIEFQNGEQYLNKARDDAYFKAFLNNLNLRPSCYDCKFKGEKRYSDITIGDFWGIERVAQKLDDNKGTSLVIINTEKGKDIFDTINSQIYSLKVDFNSSISGNSAYSKSVYKNKRREKFFEEILQNDNFDLVVKKYTKPNIIRKVKNFIKKLLAKKGRR